MVINLPLLSVLSLTCLFFPRDQSSLGQVLRKSPKDFTGWMSSSYPNNSAKAWHDNYVLNYLFSKVN